MTAPAITARPVPRVLHGLLALALSAGWLVAAALPAAAAQDWGMQSPGAGQVITGGFPVEAYTVTFAEQRVDRVLTRFRRGELVVGEVQTLDQGSATPAGLPGQTRTTWQGSMSVQGMPNGRYVVEAQVTDALYPDGSPWRGYEVIVDVPPSASLEMVRVADPEARTVEVRWARSSAPDHVRYVVQRAHGAGPFADVHSVATVDSSVYTDTVPEYGDYRYRIQVVRKAADGGENAAVSEPRSVSVQPDSSGRPESGEEPDGPLGERGEGPGGEPGGEPPGSEPAYPQLSTRSPGSVPPPSSTSSRSQRPNVAPPTNPNTVFEERLDYGVELPEWDEGSQPDPSELADAGGDGGTLTVFGGDESAGNEALKPVAGGLVLTMFGLHIVRFLRQP